MAKQKKQKKHTRRSKTGKTFTAGSGTGRAENFAFGSSLAVGFAQGASGAGYTKLFRNAQLLAASAAISNIGTKRSSGSKAVRRLSTEALIGSTAGLLLGDAARALKKW